MAIPSSGALTLAQIQTEFGGSNPISINEYYAGGANVPSGTSGTNGAVPTSGTISFNKFYGTSDTVPLVVTGGDTFVSGYDSRLGAGSKTVVSSAASVGTVSGGTPGYSYLWQYVSGTSFGITTSTSTSTTFSKSIFVPAAGSTVESGVYRCRVTDSIGTIAYGANCTVQLQLDDLS